MWIPHAPFPFDLELDGTFHRSNCLSHTQATFPITKPMCHISTFTKEPEHKKFEPQLTKSRFIEQRRRQLNFTHIRSSKSKTPPAIRRIPKKSAKKKEEGPGVDGAEMFGNWKLAATFRPLGRLRWLMEGSWCGYLGVALSAKRSLIGLH